MSPEQQGLRTNPPSPFPPSQTFGVAEIVLSERLDDKNMKLPSLFRMFLIHAETALSSATNKQEYFRQFVLQQRLYSLHPSAVEDYPVCTLNLGFPSVVSVPSVVSLS